MRRTRVKICCIASLEEARLAIEAGADALGLVSAMPSGPGVIPDARAAEIAASVPAQARTVLLSSRTDAGGLVAQQRAVGADVLQLVDRVGPDVHRQLAAALPGVWRVQVVHVTGPDAVAEALAAAETADALLLDSGNPARAVKELGGTGRVHDWDVSREIARRAPVPVILAGGLQPDLVAEAIRHVRPFALDVCSGVRTAGRLDAARLAAFMAAVRAADARRAASGPR